MRKTGKSLVLVLFLLAIPVLIFMGACDAEGNLDLIVSTPTLTNWTIAGTGTGTREHTRIFTQVELESLNATVSFVGGSATLTVTQVSKTSTTQLHGLGISAGTIPVDATGVSPGYVTMKVAANNITAGSVVISW